MFRFITKFITNCFSTTPKEETLRSEARDVVPEIDHCDLVVRESTTYRYNPSGTNRVCDIYHRGTGEFIGNLRFNVETE